MANVRRDRSKGYHNGHPSSVIPYIGGKFNLIDSIVPILEYAANTYHLRSYYEMCGGGARMLLNMPVSLFTHRVYNEVHLGLCNLFACVGLKPEVYELMALLEDVGVGEDVFLQARHALAYESSMISRGHSFRLEPVESAAYTFILAMQSRSADMTSTFDSTRLSDKRRLRSYFKRVKLAVNQFWNWNNRTSARGSTFVLPLFRKKLAVTDSAENRIANYIHP